MAKVQTGQIADGAVTESKATFSDSGGHDHSGSGNNGTPVNRGNILLVTDTGTQNNYSPTGKEGKDIIGFVGGGDVIVTGFVGDGHVKHVKFVNLSDFNVTFNDQDAGSAAANQFYLGLSSALIIKSGDYACFNKNPALSKWMLSDIHSGYGAGDWIWLRSSDAGAFTAHPHREEIAASNIVGRTASSGLKGLTGGEVRTLLNVAEIGYGEMYVSTPTQTTLAAVPTYTKIAGTTTIGDATGFDMPANNRLRYTGTITRKFKIEAFLTLTITNNDTLYFRIVKNGTTEIAKSEQRQYITAGNTRLVPLAATVELAQNDYIEIFAARAGAAANATAQKMMVIATPVN